MALILSLRYLRGKKKSFPNPMDSSVWRARGMCCHESLRMRNIDSLERSEAQCRVADEEKDGANVC